MPIPFLGREDPVEKGTATHSNILAWRSPWTEKFGGLQSMGLHNIFLTLLILCFCFLLMPSLPFFFEYLRDLKQLLSMT